MLVSCLNLVRPAGCDFMKHIVFLVLFFGLILSYFAQDGFTQAKYPANLQMLEVSSRENPEAYNNQFLRLEAEFKGSNDNEKLLALYAIHTDFLERMGEMDSLVSVLHTLRSLQKGQDKRQLTDTYLDLALAFDQKGNYDSLLYWSAQAGALIDSESPFYGKYLVTESLRSKFDGSYLESIEKLIQAIKIFESQDEDQNLANAYVSLAFFYGRIGDLKNQEVALLNALEINKALNNSDALIGVYNNLGVCLKNQGKLSEALVYYDLAYDLLEVRDSPLPIAQNLTNRANIYEALKDFEMAEELFLESEEVCQTHEIKYGILLSNLNLGNLYRQMKKFSQAKTRLDTAITLSRLLKNKREEYLTLERLAWLERDRGNFGEAYQFLADFHVLRDSLVNESVQKEALALTEKYESEKKENAIILLSKEKLQQQFWILSLIFGLFLLVFATLWVVNKNRLLQQEKQEEQQRLRYELELKDKELLTDAIRRVSIMQTKDALASELKELIQDLPKTQAQKFKKIQRELAASKDESLLKEFETRFLGVYESFFARLKEFAPDLTPTELRTAALIRLNFTSKEIASITNRSVGTIDNLRSSIRRKMVLTDDEHLARKLSDI